MNYRLEGSFRCSRWPEIVQRRWWKTLPQQPSLLLFAGEEQPETIAGNEQGMGAGLRRRLAREKRMAASRASGFVKKGGGEYTGF